jgi:hypothetical protein
MDQIVDKAPFVEGLGLTSLRVRLLRICLAVVFVGITTSSWAASVTTSEQKMGLYSLIDSLTDSATLNRSIIEQLTGTKLSMSSSGVFNRYEAHNIMLTDASIELIDYREPSSNVATRGALLVLTLADTCVRKDDVFAHYSPLAISSTPSGHSLDEQTYFSKSGPRGRLSFGFMERSRDCLKTVIIE